MQREKNHINRFFLIRWEVEKLDGDGVIDNIYVSETLCWVCFLCECIIDESLNCSIHSQYRLYVLGIYINFLLPFILEVICPLGPPSNVNSREYNGTARNLGVEMGPNDHEIGQRNALPNKNVTLYSSRQDHRQFVEMVYIISCSNVWM